MSYRAFDGGKLCSNDKRQIEAVANRNECSSQIKLFILTDRGNFLNSFTPTRWRTDRQ